MIKEELPDTPIIFGGIHPTSVPERVIKNDFVDMVCVGEGEYPMLELANSLERGKIDYSIQNLWFKKDGQIIQNPIRPLVEDLDSLPMPDKDLYYSASPHFSQCYYIMASRGCAYSCSYCCNSYLRKLYKDKGAYLRQRSVENVMLELRKAKARYRFRYIRFFDDSLGFDIRWLQEFCQQYKKQISLPFICYLHPEHVVSKSVKSLKESNCVEIEIGVQSGAERIRDTALNRKMSNYVIEKAIDLIKHEKISLVTDNIFGLPGETEDDIIDLAKFYNKRRANRIYFFWLRFYPNIAITEYVKKTGLLSDSQYEDIMDGKDANPFSRGGDVRCKKTANLQFLFFSMHFLPPVIFKYLITHKFYRLFPHMHKPAVLAAFTSLFSSAFNDRIVHKRESMRYFYSLMRFFLKNTYG
jgi:radical SAM superfamily enzyme YgiQ (UPF0313 family)